MTPGASPDELIAALAADEAATRAALAAAG